MNEHRAVLIPGLNRPGERAGQAPRLQVCRAGWGITSWELQHSRSPDCFIQPSTTPAFNCSAPPALELGSQGAFKLKGEALALV